MWALTENEMREREEDLKFDRLRHSLGGGSAERDFADLRRARSRKAASKKGPASYQYRAPQIDYEYDEYLDGNDDGSAGYGSATKVSLRKKDFSPHASSSDYLDQYDEFRWYDPQWSVIGAITQSKSITGPHRGQTSHSHHWRAQNDA